MWRGAVASSIRGKRGQAFLKDLRDALKAMPIKRLIVNELQTSTGEVCALGALGEKRQIDMKEIDPYCYEEISGKFNIAEALAREIEYENDERYDHSPEARYIRMLAWVEASILPEPPTPTSEEEK